LSTSPNQDTIHPNTPPLSIQQRLKQYKNQMTKITTTQTTPSLLNKKTEFLPSKTQKKHKKFLNSLNTPIEKNPETQKTQTTQNETAGSKGEAIKKTTNSETSQTRSTDDEENLTKKKKKKKADDNTPQSPPTTSTNEPTKEGTSQNRRILKEDDNSTSAAESGSDDETETKRRKWIDDKTLDDMFDKVPQDTRAIIYVEKLLKSETAVTREIGQMIKLFKVKTQADFVLDQIDNGDWGAKVFLTHITQEEANDQLTNKTLDLVRQDNEVLRYQIVYFNPEMKTKQRGDPPNIKVFRVYNLNPMINDENIGIFFTTQGTLKHAHMEHTKIGTGEFDRIRTTRCLLKFDGIPDFVLDGRAKAMFDMRKFKKMKYVFMNAPAKWKADMKAYTEAHKVEFDKRRRDRKRGRQIAFDNEEMYIPTLLIDSPESIQIAKRMKHDLHTNNLWFVECWWC